jgi:hypothetical protein
VFRDFVLFIKYPYTAGVVATVWVGTAVLIAIDPQLPVLRMILIDCVVTYVIAFIGFRESKE